MGRCQPSTHQAGRACSPRTGSPCTRPPPGVTSCSPLCPKPPCTVPPPGGLSLGPPAGHLALILRGGREEPRPVLLADVDDLEREDIAGCGLLGRPHHSEGVGRGSEPGPSCGVASAQPAPGRSSHRPLQPEGREQIRMTARGCSGLKAERGAGRGRRMGQRQAVSGRGAEVQEGFLGRPHVGLQARTHQPRCPAAPVWWGASSHLGPCLAPGLHAGGPDRAPWQSPPCRCGLAAAPTALQRSDSLWPLLHPECGVSQSVPSGAFLG